MKKSDFMIYLLLYLLKTFFTQNARSVHLNVFLSPKNEILSLITHSHVVPNLKDLCSSSEHNFEIQALNMWGPLWGFGLLAHW